ncbi:MAG: hypothetical protein OEZ68_01580 [Gammaproteobacteria bacterium]|nr:hypothetical protein [Gammaproteobacteria bacterium]MDH5799470.1 hypothetical protein [Gammaproteobacteria bacterium]
MAARNILDFSQPLRIAAFGLDDYPRKSLEKALRNSKHCATLVDQKTAEAGLFDYDNSDTCLCWNSYRKRCPDLPTIVIGSTDPKLPNTFYVSKPVRISKLKEAIHAIKQSQPNHSTHYQPPQASVSHIDSARKAVERIPVLDAEHSATVLQWK